MTEWGYTMMTEQSGPKALIRDVVAAEAAGFDFSVISDRYNPWLDAMGHSPYAWSVLGAAAQATDRIGLMTYVTSPIKRYHPGVVAQKAATVDLLYGGYVSDEGRHFQVDSAKIWDLPERPVPVVIAVSGPQSCALAGQKADAMIAVEPRRRLVDLFERGGGTGKLRIGQIPVSYDTDRDAAIRRVHDQFR
jgi:alkanesulfonate monooxygenase SsuD/methylene tetrahydromethanopterin reductase-like flavin-dependent oxidoreductase (luciferase family)